MIIVAGFLLLTACAAHAQEADLSAHAGGVDSLGAMATGAGIAVANLGILVF
jgi:hypothetical protein